MINPEQLQQQLGNEHYVLEEAQSFTVAIALYLDKPLPVKHKNDLQRVQDFTGLFPE